MTLNELLYTNMRTNKYTTHMYLLKYKATLTVVSVVALVCQSTKPRLHGLHSRRMGLIVPVTKPTDI